MTSPLNLTAEALAAESMEVQRKLGAGVETLRNLDEVEYGATHKEEVWRDGRVALYRYRGEQAPTAKVPLLISYALVNRPYMVDLQSDRSIVKGLLARGEDVYIIDWSSASSVVASTTCAGPTSSMRSTCSASARAACSRCATRRCIRTGSRT
jgi:poly(3-hydroxyalkanoate) synthetase